MSKPFHHLELVNRIKNHLTAINKKSIKEVGGTCNIKLNKNSKIVRINSYSVKLTKTEFKLFKYLLDNKGVVIPVENILVDIWSENYSKQLVRSYIGRLRVKFKNLEIKTIRGKGIIFE